MTKRHAGWTVAMILVMEATGLAQQSTLNADAALTVCLTFSRALEMDAPLKTAILAEVNRIWRPMGITVDVTEEFRNPCDRWILVKSALEAQPEDAAGQTAIAWVPFVEKRARRVVYVRMSHARALIDAFHPKTMLRPPAQTDALLAKLVGRSLAHELGHVLLNSLAHERSGLMRARYHPDDVLRDLPSAFTLNAEQRARLFAR
jgi:hypothetical protein